MTEKIQSYIEQQLKLKEYRPVAVAILVNNGNQVLLTKTPVEGAKTPWSFPQGGIDQNEDLEKATARELDEELPGVISEIGDGSIFGFLRREVAAEAGRVDKRGFTKGKAYIFSLLRYQGNNDFQINSSEVAEARWLSFEEAREYLSLARAEKSALLIEALEVAQKLIS